MSWNEDRLLFAIAHAGLAVSPRNPIDTERFITALAEHGFEIAPPRSRAAWWLDAMVGDIVRAGWGWPLRDGPALPSFDAHRALTELRADGVVVRHVDDPTDEDMLVRGVSDDALRREVLRRGLAFEDYEPTTGPTP